MTYERPVFLFALTLSGILSASETRFAIASNPSQSQVLSKQISVVKTVETKQLNQAVLKESTDKNLVVQQSELQEELEQEEIINKRWTGIGIGVTSTFFCFLLWILFKPNSQVKNVSTPDYQNDHEQDNQINLANNDQLELQEEMSSNLLINLKDNNFNSKPSAEQTVVQKTHLVGDKQYNSDLTINENIKDTTAKYKPVQTNANNQELAHLSTAIDEVFELIKDLKNSDHQQRRKVIWELARTGDSRSIEPLIDTIPLVNSLDKSLILSAISQIAHRNFEPIYDVLFASLKDANSEVRKDAIRDIIALHNSTNKISQHLHLMLNDSDKEVRQTAKWALKRINVDSLSQPKKYIINNAISAKNKSKQN